MVDENRFDGAAWGRLLSSHTPTQTRRRGNLVGGVVSLVFGFILLGTGIFAAAADSRLIAVCGSAGLMALLTGGWSLWTNRREKDLTVRLYEEGIVYARNGRVATIRWDEVTQLFVNLTYNRKLKSTTHLYRLHDAAGQKMVLQFNDEQLEGVSQLGETIQREVNGRLLPRTTTALRQGRVVEFGKFWLSPQGIGFGEKHLSWAETAGVEVQRGVVSVRRNGQKRPWARVESLQIPNVMVFTTLAEQMVNTG